MLNGHFRLAKVSMSTLMMEYHLQNFGIKSITILLAHLYSRRLKHSICLVNSDYIKINTSKRTFCYLQSSTNNIE